jgi:hypothetical protein
MKLDIHISWWVRPYMIAAHFIIRHLPIIHPRKIERFAVRYGMKLKVKSDAVTKRV